MLLLPTTCFTPTFAFITIFGLLLLFGLDFALVRVFRRYFSQHFGGIFLYCQFCCCLWAIICVRPVETTISTSKQYKSHRNVWCVPKWVLIIHSANCIHISVEGGSNASGHCLEHIFANERVNRIALIMQNDS